MLTTLRSIDRRLGLIVGLLQAVVRGEQEMSDATDNPAAAVQRETSVVALATTLISGLAAQIKATSTDPQGAGTGRSDRRQFRHARQRGDDQHAGSRDCLIATQRHTGNDGRPFWAAFLDTMSYAVSPIETNMIAAPTRAATRSVLAPCPKMIAAMP
jgi:hypothetical protein